MQEAKVGDYIGFKSDVEQYAKVIKIVYLWTVSGNKTKAYVVEAPEGGFQGDYIYGQTEHIVSAKDAWCE